MLRRFRAPLQARAKRPASAKRDNGSVHVGIHMAQCGSAATPDAVRASVLAAETLGYHSVWVRDCLLARATPPAEPAEPAQALDPLATLAYAAAVSDRVGLGTSVLVGPWYPPILLARSLASLDVLSQGRLTVGLDLGTGHDELLDGLDAAWSPTPGRRRQPRFLLAASTPAGLDRVARRADGWNPAGLPVDRLAPLWAGVRDRAGDHGRDPDALALVVRADIRLTEGALDGDRPAYAGRLDQVADDLDATRRAGAHEVILSVSAELGIDAALAAYAALAEALELRRAA